MQNDIIKNLISVPRSGQHMTEKAMRLYYKLLGKDYTYCEYYTCCQCRPCKKEPLAFQKNHDFNIGTENEIKINSDEKYVFIYRDNIVQQMEAHFRLILSESKKIPNSSVKIDYKKKINLFKFKKFVIQHANYYKQIYPKYLNYKENNILHVEYDNYIQNFTSVFKTILQLFNLPINEDYIRSVKNDIQPELFHKISSEDSYYSELNNFIQQQINKID